MANPFDGDPAERLKLTPAEKHGLLSGGQSTPDQRRQGGAATLTADFSKAAIVVTDMIYHQLDPARGIIPTLAARGTDASYYLDRVDKLVVPNHRRLLSAARAAGIPIVFTTAAAHRADYRDRSPNSRANLTWRAMIGTRDTEVVAELREPDDIFLPKYAASSFASTLDAVLRNMGVETVIHTGVATNGCVLASALAGFDIGYRGYLVHDATATLSQHLQDITEEILTVFMHGVVSTEDLVRAISAESGPGSAVEGAESAVSA